MHPTTSVDGNMIRSLGMDSDVRTILLQFLNLKEQTRLVAVSRTCESWLIDMLPHAASTLRDYHASPYSLSLQSIAVIFASRWPRKVITIMQPELHIGGIDNATWRKFAVDFPLAAKAKNKNDRSACLITEMYNCLSRLEHLIDLRLLKLTSLFAPPNEFENMCRARASTLEKMMIEFKSDSIRLLALVMRCFEFMPRLRKIALVDLSWRYEDEDEDENEDEDEDEDEGEGEGEAEDVSDEDEEHNEDDDDNGCDEEDDISEEEVGDNDEGNDEEMHGLSQQSFEVLPTLEDLSYFSFLNWEDGLLTADQVRAISRCAKLETLQVGRWGVSNSDPRSLEEQLQNLTILADGPASRSLTNLSLDQTTIDSSAWKILQRFEKLNNFKAVEWTISDEEWQQLCPMLKHLSKFSVPDAYPSGCMAVLYSTLNTCTQLTELEISQRKMTDDQLRSLLAGLIRITKLTFTSMKFDSLQPLSTASPTLTHLVLTRSRQLKSGRFMLTIPSLPLMPHIIRLSIEERPPISLKRILSESARERAAYALVTDRFPLVAWMAFRYVYRYRQMDEIETDDEEEAENKANGTDCIQKVYHITNKGVYVYSTQ